MRMKIVIACIAPLFAAGCIVVPIGGARSGSDFKWTPPQSELNAARDGITKTITTSAQAWNRGDLDAFMDSYEPDTTTTYISRNGILRGRAAIRAAYADRFAPGASHGTLTFPSMEIDLVAPGVANVIGRWRLANGDSTVGAGFTSLVMRLHNNAWRIVHDHSS